MKPAQFSDIICSITVCDVYSVLSLMLERKGSTLPVLTNTFVECFPFLQLTSQTFLSSVWLPVAKRVIAQNVGSHWTSEEIYQSFQKEIRSVPKLFLNIKQVGIRFQPLQKKELDLSLIHSGPTFHIPIYLPVSPLTFSINFTKVSLKTILSVGVLKLQEKKKLTHDFTLSWDTQGFDTSKMVFHLFLNGPAMSIRRCSEFLLAFSLERSNQLSFVRPFQSSASSIMHNFKNIPLRP